MTLKVRTLVGAHDDRGLRTRLSRRRLPFEDAGATWWLESLWGSSLRASLAKDADEQQDQEDDENGSNTDVHVIPFYWSIRSARLFPRHFRAKLAIAGTVRRVRPWHGDAKGRRLMGLMRKTLSVGTIGLISFRSKKERLQRAERAKRDAEESLEREHVARVAAERRAKHPKRRRAKRRERKHARTNEAVAVAVERGRRAGRAARKAAKRSVVEAKEAATTVKEVATTAKEAATPKVEAMATRAADKIEQLTTQES